MYNDNFNQDREHTSKYDYVQRQPMGSEEFIPSPSDSVSQMQQMDGQPRSAPPDFIPELPNMERRQMGEEASLAVRVRVGREGRVRVGREGQGRAVREGQVRVVREDQVRVVREGQGQVVRAGRVPETYSQYRGG